MSRTCESGTPTLAENSLTSASSDALLCSISCEFQTGVCAPTDTYQNTAHGKSIGVVGATRAPGRACNNYNGYCNQYGLCQGVTADNPFMALGSFDFNSWFAKYWPEIVGTVVGLIVFGFLMRWMYKKREQQIDGMFNRWAGKLNQTLFRKKGGAKGAVSAKQDNLDKFRKLKQGLLCCFIFDLITHVLRAADGVKRLRRFFPTVQNDATLQQVMSAAKTEEDAVIKLLKMGFPLAAL